MFITDHITSKQRQGKVIGLLLNVDACTSPARHVSEDDASPVIQSQVAWKGAISSV